MDREADVGKSPGGPPYGVNFVSPLFLKLYLVAAEVRMYQIRRRLSLTESH